MAEDSEISDEASQGESKPVEAKPATNLPFIITLVALLIYFSFQSVSLLTERGNLSMVKGNQDAALQEAQKVQTQFKTLVTKTSELADQGHAGAKLIMEGLQKQGVGFAPESAAPAKAETKAETKATK
jgi:hypothetical protein